MSVICIWNNKYVSYWSTDHTIMRALTKFVLWRLVVLIGLFAAAIFAANQALAIALLTPPSESASQLDSLTVKAWGYLIVSAALFVFDLWLLVRTIKHVNRTGS